MSALPVEQEPASMLRRLRMALERQGQQQPQQQQPQVPVGPSQGVYGQQYANSLATSAQNELGGGAYQAALGLRADAEARSLAAQFAAQLAQRQAEAELDALAKLRDAYIRTNPDKYGVFDQGIMGDLVNPEMRALRNNMTVQTDRLENYKTASEGAKNFVDSGIDPSTTFIANALRLMRDETPVPIKQFDPQFRSPETAAAERMNTEDNQAALERARIGADAHVAGARYGANIKFDPMTGRPLPTVNLTRGTREDVEGLIGDAENLGPGPKVLPITEQEQKIVRDALSKIMPGVTWAVEGKSVDGYHVSGIDINGQKVPPKVIPQAKIHAVQ